MDRETLIKVGKITAAHGVKGYVCIMPFTEEAKNILDLNITNKELQSIKLSYVRYLEHKNLLICKVDGVLDRNAAESLIGTELFCLRDSLPQISKEDEFYAVDLVGRKVKDMQGKTVGFLKAFYNFGAGDIVEIEFESNKSTLFPFIKTIFPEIGLDHIKFNCRAESD